MFLAGISINSQSKKRILAVLKEEEINGIEYIGGVRRMVLFENDFRRYWQWKKIQI